MAFRSFILAAGFLGLVGSKGHAEPFFIMEIAAKYRFLAEATQDCEQLKIAGIYKVEINDNGFGRIINDKDEDNYIFFDGKNWVSRSESYDFDANVREYRTLSLDDELTKFHYQVDRYSQGSRTAKTQICTGTVKPVP